MATSWCKKNLMMKFSAILTLFLAVNIYLYGGIPGVASSTPVDQQKPRAAVDVIESETMARGMMDKKPSDFDSETLALKARVAVDTNAFAATSQKEREKKTIKTSETKYQPNWDSIDSRPLPSWFDEGKIGIFMHWGVFSVPSKTNEWFWEDWKSGNNATVQYMKENFKPNFTYPDFAPMFTTEFFNPAQWAELFEAAGAKYVVLTSKHHEGFTNWPSKYSFAWNSMDVGPNRDLVGELGAAVRKWPDIHFGLYHSLFEWFNPLYMEDAANHYKTNRFVKFKTMPELYELVENYKPDVIWSDGDWMVDDFYWDALDFLAWLYNDSPVKDTVCVNDRWGKNIRCKHGGFLNCNDRYNPGILQKRKWENAMTLDRGSWGYRREATFEDYLTMPQLLKTMAITISCGGNLLVNIGPTHDGRIIPMMEQRLREMGGWLGVNGEAIYKSRPWKHQNDTVNPAVWYTSKPGAVYAILLEWPQDNKLILGAPSPNTDTTEVHLLGYNGLFSWQLRPQGGMIVNIPDIPFYKMPCEWAWVFKLEKLNNHCVMEILEDNTFGKCV